MTYQSEFLRDRYAQTAAQIGQAQGKSAEWMHATAWDLYIKNTQREAIKGKPMSDDHLKQEAVKMARAA